MFSRRFSRLWCLLLCAGCFFPLTPARAATGDSARIDVNFFYDTLKDEGSWFNTTEYGDVWQPYIAYKSEEWRPYTDGYWSYTDGGWMFVSNESFGWAVYHYGRWTKLEDIGWAWVPGTEWAPAWVTWRESKPADDAGAPPAAAVSATTTDAPDTKDAPPPPDRPVPPAGDDSYVGWAPLPPVPIVAGTGYSYGPGVDVEFGIDPDAYVFTGYRSFGDPWLAGVVFGRDRGFYCCEHSVNITNVYYHDRGGYRGFYNGGPDYTRLRGATARRIQQLAIQRSTSSALVRQQVREGRFNTVSGNHINVAAPRFSSSSVRNGRVNFSRRGALPVTPVAKQLAPASAAENPAYRQARESFARQGEAYRAQGAAAQSARPKSPVVATTPRARSEERQARQAAERRGGAKPETTRTPGEQRQVAHPGAAAGRHEVARRSGGRRRGGGMGRAGRQERHGGGGRRGGGGEHRGGGDGGKKKK